MEQKIIDFVKNNNLEFDSYGSTLNANIVILVGYATYLNQETSDKFRLDFIYETILENDERACDEFDRIWNYVNDNGHDYASFWKSKEAKEQYNF